MHKEHSITTAPKSTADPKRSDIKPNVRELDKLALRDLLTEFDARVLPHWPTELVQRARQAIIEGRDDDCDAAIAQLEAIMTD